MIFLKHKLETTQVDPEINIFGYDCNGIKMAGGTYSLNTTLCFGFLYGTNSFASSTNWD